MLKDIVLASYIPTIVIVLLVFSLENKIWMQTILFSPHSQNSNLKLLCGLPRDQKIYQVRRRVANAYISKPTYS